MAHWVDHPRRNRKRANRAHRGAEFQLETKHLEIIDRYAERIEAADRSEALRHLLERTQDLPERIRAAWHGLDEYQPRSEVMEDLAAIAAWVGGLEV